MRSLIDRLGPATLRDLLLVNAAVGLVGVSYGAITVGAGFELWVPTLMSIVVFGGASQFLFTGLIAAGASPIAAVAAGALVNARHLPFGFALADTVSKRPWLGGYLMIDEVVAFALAEPDRARRRLIFFTCGAMLWTFWNVGALLGGLLGQAIPDTDAWGLDAAFPAVLLALVVPAMRQARIRNASLLGAAIALALTPFVPAGLAVLCALAALLVVPPRPRRDRGSPDRADDDATGDDATEDDGTGDDATEDDGTGDDATEDDTKGTTP